MRQPKEWLKKQDEKANYKNSSPRLSSRSKKLDKLKKIRDIRKGDKLVSIEDMFSFMVAASDAVKDRGKVYEFTCPLCGRTAKAAKAKSNGHLHAVCKCGIQIMS